MLDQALSGGFANPPADASRAFRAAMTAMARPGTIVDVADIQAPDGLSIAAATLLLTLCDHETPLMLAPDVDRPALRQWIAFHLGAPIVGRGGAMFAIGGWDALLPLADYAVGTPEYPDRSATLIVEMPELTNTGARLTGPGIRTEAHISLPDASALAARGPAFPLGLDLFLTSGRRLAALPRTTRVEDL
jgi:alpha-D-ribose 1-methylphosphonate 5-triphosphate synthase subunit PhnH